MPKEVRYNDKFWFGKYKNKRIRSILSGDIKYVDSLIEKGMITLDNKLSSHYEALKRDMYRNKEDERDRDSWDEFDNDDND